MIDLTREHTEMIRAVICKTSGSPLPKDVIDDLTSDTVVQLLEPSGSRSLSKYDADRGMALTTFIGMVAKSVTLDHFRRTTRKNKRTVSLDSPPETGLDNGTHEHVAGLQVADHSEDALSMLIRREQRHRLEAALQTLSKSDQEFLATLLGGDEDTAKRMAREENVGDSAIRVRKSRIAERLRRAIQSQG